MFLSSIRSSSIRNLKTILFQSSVQCWKPVCGCSKACLSVSHNCLQIQAKGWGWVLLPCLQFQLRHDQASISKTAGGEGRRAHKGRRGHREETRGWRGRRGNERRGQEEGEEMGRGHERRQRGGNKKGDQVKGDKAGGEMWSEQGRVE